MKRSLLGISLSFLLALPSFAASPAQAELVSIMQTLMDSIATGERAPWERHLADEMVLLDRDGSVKRKQELVEGTAPIKPGYTLKIAMTDIDSFDLGDTAVLMYRVLEDMTVFGQPLHVEYRNSHVFARRKGEWKMLLWSYVELPRDGAPVKVDPARFDELTGEYALSEAVKYTVTRRDDRLFIARAGRGETELVPESPDVFYSPGSEFRKIFVRDAKGKVTELLDRRKGSDTTWKKVK